MNCFKSSKKRKTEKQGIKGKRLKTVWDNQYLLKVLVYPGKR